MYRISVNGDLVALCDEPNYIKVNPTTGVYIPAKKDEAVGVAAGGVAYNLPGHAEITDAPEAFVTKVDVGEYIFDNKKTIAVNAEDADTRISSLEDAICDLDILLSEEE